VTAAKELMAEETVDREPDKRPAINSPGTPGTFPSVSTTKSGRSCRERERRH